MLCRDENHVYTWDGKPVLSVTQIMGVLRDFTGIPPEVLELASQRGTATHTACALDDEGRLDESSIDPQIRPYVEAWRRFRETEKPEWVFAERPIYHTTRRYAGEPDRAGYVFGDYAVVEIKTVAQMHPAFGVQLAGYVPLVLGEVEFHSIHQLRRFAIQLRKDATYRVHEYTSALDDAVFASCLTIHNWGILNGK